MSGTLPFPTRQASGTSAPLPAAFPAPQIARPTGTRPMAPGTLIWINALPRTHGYLLGNGCYQACHVGFTIHSTDAGSSGIAACRRAPGPRQAIRTRFRDHYRFVVTRSRSSALRKDGGDFRPPGPDSETRDVRCPLRWVFRDRRRDRDDGAGDAADHAGGRGGPARAGVRHRRGSRCSRSRTSVRAQACQSS